MICNQRVYSVGWPLWSLACFALSLGVWGWSGTSVLAATQSVMTDGHADMGVAFSPFEMEAHVHGGSVVDGATLPADQEFEPDEVVFLVAHARVAPLDNSLNFTGAAAGASFWTLPESFTAGVPFLGISSEHLNPAEWVGDLTWTVTAVTRPAGSEFSMWVDGLAGPEVAVSTLAGLPGQFVLPVGSHNHFNYGFSLPGLYAVSFEVSGTHLIDGPQTAQGTFYFRAVPEPGTLSLAALAGVCVALRSRRRKAAI